MTNILKNHKKLGAALAAAALAATGSAAQAQSQYSRPSPNYERLEDQPYQGPSGQTAPDYVYYQAWGYNNYTTQDGRTVSIEGCWDVARHQFLDSDGQWKTVDRVIGQAINKSKAMCNLTNPLSGVIRRMPAPGPNDSRYRYGY